MRLLSTAGKQKH